MQLSTLALLALSMISLGEVFAKPGCDTSASCSFNFQLKHGKFTLNLRRLCNSQKDYVISDKVGHTYYAQICGNAQKNCLPQTWENEYEYGHVIQTWGARPDCDTSPKCFDETGAAVCCTENCQVVAVSNPTARVIDPNNLNLGFEITYMGETPTTGDPYPCPPNPQTHLPYPRTTHMQFICDPDVDGFASLFEVDNNATDDCDYTLKFKTSAACVSRPLSGGWVFNIIVFVVSFVYVAGAYAWNYYRNKKFEFPASQKAIWTDLNILAMEGLMYALSGFKRPSPDVVKQIRLSAGSNSSESGSKFGGYGSSPIPSESSTTATAAFSGSSFQSSSAPSVKANAFSEL